LIAILSICIDDYLSIVIYRFKAFDQGIAFLKWRFDRLEVVLCLVQVGWDSWEYDPNIAIF
jgi:hypothetical protein